MTDYDVMILGAGSVGCVIGGYLASTGASVLLVNRRADTMVAVAEKGLRLETEAGMIHTTPD
ncbi:MAG: 2-dehydropantoate 2-reductase N-terminal domain-containing protein, partial [Candidatus Puniceispirillaceae bacterium]